MPLAASEAVTRLLVYFAIACSASSTEHWDILLTAAENVKETDVNEYPYLHVNCLQNFQSVIEPRSILKNKEFT